MNCTAHGKPYASEQECLKLGRVGRKGTMNGNLKYSNVTLGHVEHVIVYLPDHFVKKAFPF
jgi:hypothetical protein